MNAPPRTPRRLTFRSGGAVLLLAMLLVAATTLWRVLDLRSSRGSRAVGDGRHPDTYGFDLRELRVPADLIVASGVSRDGLPVLDGPPLWPASRVDSLARAGRSKYLVPSDRVIGVTRHGQSRAYPLLALNWHEVVNDTLGGSPILVTYNPLCDGVAVYDRSDETATAPLYFGHSGLLYNSDLLLYDRRPGHSGESLWIQLTGEAISQPAAGNRRRLRALPCAVLPWEDWKDRHPHTTVLARDPARRAEYKRDPYVSYRGNDLLRFPVRPLPPKTERDYKSPGLVLESNGRAVFFPIGPAAGTGSSTIFQRVTFNGIPLNLGRRDRPPTAWIELDGGADGEGSVASVTPSPMGTSPGSTELPAVRYAFWFAWFALNQGQVEEGRWGGPETIR